MCDLTLTQASTCGGLTSYDIEIRAKGTVGGVAGGSTAGTVLGTYSTTNPTSAITITNTTAVDVASSITGSITTNPQADENTIPEDVDICYTVTDACGTSTETCDEVIAAVGLPKAFFASTWATGTYQAGGVGTTMSPANSATYGLFNDTLYLKNDDGSTVSSGTATIVLDSQNGDTLTLSGNIGSLVSSYTVTGSTGKFVGNEAAAKAGLTFNVSDGAAVSIQKKTIADATGMNYEAATNRTVANSVEGTKTANERSEARDIMVSVTITDNGMGLASTNTDNFAILDRVLGIRFTAIAIEQAAPATTDRVGINLGGSGVVLTTTYTVTSLKANSVSYTPQPNGINKWYPDVAATALTVVEASDSDPLSLMTASIKGNGRFVAGSMGLSFLSITAIDYPSLAKFGPFNNLLETSGQYSYIVPITATHVNALINDNHSNFTYTLNGGAPVALTALPNGTFSTTQNVNNNGTTYRIDKYVLDADTSNGHISTTLYVEILANF